MDNTSFAVLCFVVSAIAMAYYAVQQFMGGATTSGLLWAFAGVVALVVAIAVFIWTRRR